eukprot:CAMPEP_0117020796 /NCGR_PEP_ID=MMETSP0472-20121206/15768_1 /TAXON_ID=693140 ORGANISM="Tiarina fusus, Strain LIS" /NCGR_SAMPLE_ID=MMETSP0472 /ASSEMBLY_ACC=CAM_ASM_000603 /LENGTH=340 /DNA_ID=CAMNT_0004726107 /DNA_START=15 /DNA_END=1034 /DNA_ORIENTATION=-
MMGKCTTAHFLLLCLVVGLCEGKIRKYFIASDEVEWNYAPSGLDNVEQIPLQDGEHSAHFFTPGPDRIGGTFIKAQYREYTDASFTELAPAEEHLGILGTIMWGEVGDTLDITFKNNARYPFSMTPHALFVTEDNQGVPPIGGGTTRSSFVQPGDIVSYKWYLPGRTSPTRNEWSSTFYPYHSHTDPIANSYAGLVGGVIVTRAGEAREDGHPKDVDREFVIMYSVIEESQSNFIDDNIAQYLGEDRVDDEDLRDEDFDFSNGMNSINGYMFGNLPGLNVVTGERVRWYSFVNGSERDIHTFHWHGQTLLTSTGRRIDIEPVFAHTPQIMDMIPDSVGTW